MRRRPFLAVTTLVVLAAAGPASAATGLKDSYLGIPTFIWLPVNLALFVYLLYHFVGKPISLYLDTRKAAIATDISDAAAKLAEAEELRLILGSIIARTKKADTKPPPNRPPRP